MKKLALVMVACLSTAGADSRPLIEAKAGYFFFTDSHTSDIYNRGGVDFQVSGRYPLYQCFHLYGSIEYLEKSGTSLNIHEKTSLWATPLSLGVQALFPMQANIDYYVTLGPRYFFVHVRNGSSFVPNSAKAKGLGGFVNTGLLWTFCERFTLGIFGEYSYKRLGFPSSSLALGRSMQVGGMTFGGEIGYRF